LISTLQFIPIHLYLYQHHQVINQSLAHGALVGDLAPILLEDDDREEFG